MTSAGDERGYEVERCFTGKTTTRYCVYDIEMGRAAWWKARKDVRDWLCEHLHVESPAIAEHAVSQHGGCAARHLHSPLPGSLRSAQGDSSTRCCRWRVTGRPAITCCRPPKQLEKQTGSVREQIARIEGQLERLPDLRGTTRHTVPGGTGLGKRLAELQGELQRALAALQALEQAEKLVLTWG